jgi:acyl-CoA hydrolase
VEFTFIPDCGAKYVDHPGYVGNFQVNSFFVLKSICRDVREGRAEFVPVFLGATPELFKQNILPLDVALVQVSPPHKLGYCSLGVSVDIPHPDDRGKRLKNPVFSGIKSFG